MTFSNPEDEKLLTLAKATAARVSATQGAAVRDETGRTYAAASVELDSITLDALELALGMALSSGATAIESAITFGSKPIARAQLAIREISPSALLASVDQDGNISTY
ncbi:MAG: cytidine deaminase [Candidatus Nanopelagicaceae bacterium]|nr:cytidine deaminase [Candidatus Nanopelagicaceae bacterium]